MNLDSRNPSITQIGASYSGYFPTEYATPEWKIGGFVIRRSRIRVEDQWQLRSSSAGFDIGDDVAANRVFRTEVPLLQAICLLSPNSQKTLVHAGGDFPTFMIDTLATAIRIDDSVGDSPRIRVIFKAYGTRYGWNHANINFAEFLFRDQAQSRRYLVFVPLRDTEVVERAIRVPVSAESGESILVPLAVGAAIGVLASI